MDRLADFIIYSSKVVTFINILVISNTTHIEKKLSIKTFHTVVSFLLVFYIQ